MNTSKSTFAMTLLMFTLSPDAYALKIKKSVSAGRTCPASQSIEVSTNNNALSISFPDLGAENDTGKRLSRTNCTVSVTLEKSEKMQYRPTHYIANIEAHSGNASDLTLNLKTWFQGDKRTTSTNLDFLNAGKSSRSNEYKLPIVDEIWSPCAKDFVVNSQASLVAKSKSGLSKDVGIKFKGGLQILWESKTCVHPEK